MAKMQLDQFYLNIGIDFEVLDKWDLAMYRSLHSYHVKDRWINFEQSENKENTNSILMYAKGNHSSLLEMFDKFYKHTNTTKPEGNNNWFVPFKDPIDKLLGGYLCTDHWNENYKDKFVAGNRENMYEEMVKVLDDLVDSTLDGSLFRHSTMIDRHTTPLSLILRNSLKEYDVLDVSRLVGIDLDARTDLMEAVYSHMFYTNPDKGKQISMHAIPTRSPYSKNQHHYVRKYKIDNPDKMKALATGPLKNDYILNDFFVHGWKI